jgi:hypothetical protein
MRRLVKRVAAPVTAALIAAGCAATTMSVSSHMERGLDFGQYRTFDWGPADALPTGDARLDKDPFFKDRVQGAVEKQLAVKGLRLSGSDAPDLLIHYHAHITDRIDPTRVDRRYGYCAGGDCPAIDYEAGTLVIDIMDARTNRLLWRGWAQDSVEDLLDDREAMGEAIDEAVTRMMQRLPRAL